MTFEKWFQDQDFYKNMRFIHGDALFIKDGDIYRVLPVQMAFEAWESRQAEVDQLKGLLEKDEYAHSLYYENLNLQTSIDEKDKRIEELEMWIKGQIETLKCASKSRVYTEREQNLMLSQADDLEKALRGKDQYTEHRSKAEQQINKGARLTKHQIDLGDKNANS